jgi:hypothetical protein
MGCMVRVAMDAPERWGSIWQEPMLRRLWRPEGEKTSSESGKNVVWTRRCRAKVLNDLGRLNLNRRLPGRLPRHHGQIAIVIRNHTDSGPYRMHGVTENGIYGLFFRPI